VVGPPGAVTYAARKIRGTENRPQFFIILQRLKIQLQRQLPDTRCRGTRHLAK
jgi:hypothetical protein